jgi:hypothetical protein
VSYFTRLTVRHLNCENKIQTNVRSLATLSWALGSLGVKYRPDEAKKDPSAFKKLHLVSPLVVSEDDGDFRKLSSRRLFKLVRSMSYIAGLFLTSVVA